MAHQKYINAVKISPNDKMIATSSQDKTIKLWDAKSLTLLKTLAGHRRGIWDIQFSPTDQLIASASGDNLLKVWSIASGQAVATLQGHQAALVKLNWLNMGL
jgi:U3 small nucleolar RNA-associated protein 13